MMLGNGCHSCGFTIIELSVVLVVIGLIMGAIVVGRELIHAGELRSTVAQIDLFNTAVGSFKLKYHCLPGDCIEAGAFGFGDPLTPGNGNGRIGLCNEGAGLSCLSGGPAAYLAEMMESTNFWYHLSAAALLGQSFKVASSGNQFTAGIDSPAPRISALSFWQTSPATPRSCGWSVNAETRFHASVGGGRLPGHTLLLFGMTLPPVFGADGVCGYYAADVQAIDAKIDDGLPETGHARGWNQLIDVGNVTQHTSSIGTGGINSLVCIRDDTAPHRYNIEYVGTAQAGGCLLAVKAPF